METMTVHPKYILCRTDGEDATDEYAWYSATSPEEYDAAEAQSDYLDPGESVEWAIYRVDPEPVSRRVFSGPKIEDGEEDA